MRKKISERQYQKSWDREALKNLKHELRIIENLKSATDEFSTLQRGGVIRLETFHVVMAVQIIRGTLPAMLKEVKKIIVKRKKMLK